MRFIPRGLGALALLAMSTTIARGDPVTGTLTYTRFAGVDRLNQVGYTFNGTTFTLGTPTVIARTTDGMVGADGLAFDPFNNHVLVGAQTSIVHRVNPVGPVVSSASTGGPAAFHLTVDPSLSTVWASGIPGTLSRVPIGPAFGAVGTTVPVVGSNTSLTTLIFTPGGTVYYTASGGGGFGAFGTVVLGATAVTTGLLAGVPAAHGGVYDPFTGDIILFGDNHVTQIDIGTNTIVSDLDLATRGLSLNLDQGTVDGAGHLFAASNTGELLFIDYSATGLVAAPANFLAAPFLAANLDDVAPLVGAGSSQNGLNVPEPAGLIAWGVIGAGCAGVRWLKRRRVNPLDKTVREVG